MSGTATKSASIAALLSFWLLPPGLPPAPVLSVSEVAEPEGYRTEAYRAPVPATLRGVTVVGNDEAMRLWRSGKVLFIDVMPRPPKPANLPEGTIWRPPTRRSIPGGAWLANVGFGVLSRQTERYFRTNLERLTAADHSKPLLFYCLATCWMSWNAAKRALSYGYETVYWYPEGTDGWVTIGGPLEKSRPAP